jgi:Family of unknown function (DUF5343)
MNLPNNYVQVYGQLPEFFSKLQQGQAPEKFTQQHLKDIGFTSSSYRALIPLLKTIGFLSADGSPTSLYHSYRNKAEASKILGGAVRNAYADLFLINDPPTERDKDLVEGKFKSTHNVGDRISELMAKTFFALAKLSDFSAQPKKPLLEGNSNPAEPLKEPASERPNGISHSSNYVTPSLHYNIQIHLPATKDLEVYNAIFKSLKEHLLG